MSRAGGNITHSGQYSTDPTGGVFFLRMQFELELGADELAVFKTAFEWEVSRRFGMGWTLTDAEQPKRMAAFVSRYEHCLLDVLWRWRRRELHAEIAVVVSNHEDLCDDVESFGLPFVHVPVDKRRGRGPGAAAGGARGARPIDVVILARHMQILGGDFLHRVGAPVVNIHHSFLPAFAGAGPYQRVF